MDIAFANVIGGLHIQYIYFFLPQLMGECNLFGKSFFAFACYKELYAYYEGL